MKTYRRICLRDYSLTDDSGNTASVVRGEEYMTSEVNDAPAIGPDAVPGHVIVFTNYWFPVPVDIFGGEIEG